MTFLLGDVARELGVVRRPCWKKQRWLSLGAAEAQLRSLLRQTWVKEPDRLNAYPCCYCKGFHIGRR